MDPALASQGHDTDAGRQGLTELVRLEGGRFFMGSSQFYPDEAPVREVTVGPFSIERHPVTNRQFAAFVADTGYTTVAERELDPRQYPDVPAASLVPGGLVFTPTDGPVPLERVDRWWRWQPGASWRHPRGPGSTVEDYADHPVVMVAYEDAESYAAWAGRRLPTEPEFEFAAQGGAPPARYAWGDDPLPDGRLMANTWQGRFPYLNTGALGWVGTSPVNSFPANGYGLVDLIGNVWEWTSSFYDTGPARMPANDVTATSSAPVVGSCCAPQTLHPATSRRPELAAAEASRAPGGMHDRRVLKGGSHLCAPEYCLRYRPAARSPQAVDSATTHVGFRCATTDNAGNETDV